jgi:hypothetical protein
MYACMVCGESYDSAAQYYLHCEKEEHGPGHKVSGSSE